MTQLTREQRKNKILLNAQKRLEKLKNLKDTSSIECKPTTDTKVSAGEHGTGEHETSEHDTSEHDTDRIATASFPPNHRTKLCDDIPEKEITGSIANEQAKQNEQFSESHNEISDIDQIESETKKTDEQIEVKKLSIFDSFFANRYRFCVFVLLAWMIFLVTSKGYDYLLAYIITQKLPKENLPLLVWSSFVAVEVQVVLLHFLFDKKATVSDMNIMLKFFFKIINMPERFVIIMMKAYTLFINATNDFCVYFFTLVFLKYLNDSVIL